MNVKVKASVQTDFDSYDYAERIVAKYTYKAEGFKKDTNYVLLISKFFNEPSGEYNKRLLKELGELTKEEVIEKVKDSIIKNLMFKVASSSESEEKKRLLKELNKIKFSFTIKDSL